MSSAFVFVGCSTESKPITNDLAEVKREMLELHRNQGSQAAAIEELNHKLLVLSDSKRPSSENNIAMVPLVPPDATLPTEKKPPITTGTEAGQSSSSGAEKLYAQAVLSAKKDQMATLQKSVTLLLKGYKESPWTNNALYLLGEKLFQKGQYLKAAEQFENLYKTFPDGNKAVSALYQLGVCYQKLGKPNEATEAFQNVVAVYPGSREARLAQKEISIENNSSKGDISE